jgi:transposase
MRKTTKSPGEKIVNNIKRATRKHYSSEEKIRIVLDGLRSEDSIAELCRREGISQGIYYKWSKGFMEAGKKRLAGDTARAANTDEVKELRREAKDLKEVVAEQTLELRLLKKSIFDSGAIPNELSCSREAGNHPPGRREPSVRPYDAGQAGHPPHHVLSLVRSLPAARRGWAAGSIS